MLGASAIRQRFFFLRERETNRTREERGPEKKGEKMKNPIYHTTYLNKKKANINLSLSPRVSFLSALLKLKNLHFARTPSCPRRQSKLTSLSTLAPKPLLVVPPLPGCGLRKKMFSIGKPHLSTFFHRLAELFSFFFVCALGSEGGKNIKHFIRYERLFALVRWLLYIPRPKMSERE